MFTFTEIATFTVLDCYKCHVEFGLPNAMYSRLKTKGESFYCPNGHSQAFVKSENAKLKEQLALAKENEEWWKRRKYEADESRIRTERQLSAAKGRITKIKNRVGNGVCPCCNRTFANVARHMENKHPGWTE